MDLQRFIIEMKGVEWGFLYNKYRNETYNIKQLSEDIKDLMIDDDVTAKKGIYEYLLSNKSELKHLNIRKFSEKISRQAYESQSGVCPSCKNSFDKNEMEADHITPWHEGGKTELSNCQMLCKECNRRKGGR